MPSSFVNFLRTEADYLVFVCMSVVVFLLIAFALRRWRGARLSMPAMVLAGAILIGGGGRCNKQGREPERISSDWSSHSPLLMHWNWDVLVTKKSHRRHKRTILFILS